jgi:hypothetical protein
MKTMQVRLHICDCYTFRNLVLVPDSQLTVMTSEPADVFSFGIILWEMLTSGE